MGSGGRKEALVLRLGFPNRNLKRSRVNNLLPVLPLSPIGFRNLILLKSL